MKVITGNPVIINKVKKSPSDYYIPFDGKSVTKDQLIAFQKWYNTNKPVVSLAVNEEGNLDNSTVQAINQLGEKYDKSIKSEKILGKVSKGIDIVGKLKDTIFGGGSGGSGIESEAKQDPMEKDKKGTGTGTILLAVGGGLFLIGIILLLATKKTK
jgi:hypothetical protein